MEEKTEKWYTEAMSIDGITGGGNSFPDNNPPSKYNQYSKKFTSNLGRPKSEEEKQMDSADKVTITPIEEQIETLENMSFMELGKITPGTINELIDMVSSSGRRDLIDRMAAIIQRYVAAVDITKTILVKKTEPGL